MTKKTPGKFPEFLTGPGEVDVRDMSMDKQRVHLAPLGDVADQPGLINPVHLVPVPRQIQMRHVEPVFGAQIVGNRIGEGG